MINTTQVLGTDSISATRMINNDNFNIVRDEINSIETYINPDSGVIDNINSTKTLELRVGTIGSYKLEVTTTTINVNSTINFTSATSFLNIKGLVAHNSFLNLKTSLQGVTTTIDPLVGKRFYTVTNDDGATYTIVLKPAEPGQSVEFFLDQLVTGGSVTLQADGSTTFTLFGATTKISLDGIGSSVRLTFVDDGVSSTWYISSGNNYSLA